MAVEASSQSAFEGLQNRLKDQYLRVEALMTNPENAGEIKDLSKLINENFTSLIKICEANPDGIPTIDGGDTVESVRQNKIEFDDRLEQWFKGLERVSEQCSHTSYVPSNRFDSSSKSSYRRTEAKIKTTLARMNLEKEVRKSELEDKLHVEQKRSLAQKRELEEKLRVEQKRSLAQKLELEDEMRGQERASVRELERLELEHSVQAAAAEEQIWDRVCSQEGTSPLFVTIDKTGFLDESELLVKKESPHVQFSTNTLAQSTPLEVSERRECSSTYSQSPAIQSMQFGPIPAETVSSNAPPLRNRDMGESEFVVLNGTPNNPVRDQRSFEYHNQHYGRPPETELNQTSDIVKLIKHMNRPKPEVMFFYGDPLNYHIFERSFNNQIDEGVDDNSSKLSYLLQHCRGSARRLIEYTAKLKPDRGYNEAKQKLKEKYGLPHIVAHACVKKVVDGPELRTNDSDCIKEYSQTLKDCLLTLDGIGKTDELNNCQVVVRASNRLPANLRKAWKRQVASLEKKQGRFPRFEDLVEFVENEDNTVNSPFSQMMDDYSKEVKKHVRNQSVRASSHNIMVDKTEIPQAKLSSLSTPSTYCLYCNKSHELFKCEEFGKRPWKDKVKFTRKLWLCDNCFKKGHISRNCRLKGYCNVNGCEDKHHRFMHPPQEDASDSSPEIARGAHNANVCSVIIPDENPCHTASNGSAVYFCIVPVKVFGNGREVETFAFLDVGSAVTLCSNKLIDMLDLEREPSEITLSTINGESKMRNSFKVKMKVSAQDGSECIDLPEVYSIDSLPMKPNAVPSRNELEKLPHLQGLKFPDVKDCDVTLMIGVNVPEAFCVQATRKGDPKQPIAWRMPLGWTLIGPVLGKLNRKTLPVNFVQTGDDNLEAQLQRMWKADFVDIQCGVETSMSREDKYALNVLEESVKFKNGHYELPLLWHPDAKKLPNNRRMAVSRLASLERKLLHDDDLREKYVNIVEDYITKGYAEEVPTDEKNNSDQIWYVPHFCVVHPHKLKPRVVFDGACRFAGRSLNESLLHGPDLVNSLLGVLLRFRIDFVALCADVSEMFHQIFVDPKDRDALRFLWWPGGDLTKEPTDHRMRVHLFGSKSSPTIANFCLRRVAKDFKTLFDEDIAVAILRSFYVDDLAKSEPSDIEGIRIKEQLTEMFKKGGFWLNKWLSNSLRILEGIPEHERAKCIKSLKFDEVLSDRVLGVHWNVTSDVFGFDFDVTPPRIFTQRSVLSIVSSLYDPLGFVAVVVIASKIMQQDLCRQGLGWDDRIPHTDAEKWTKWLIQLSGLSDVTLSRCFKPEGFGRIMKTQLHNFADASSVAYGAVTYLRFIDESGRIHCAFVMGKARVAPIKATSIPRLELTRVGLRGRL